MEKKIKEDRSAQSLVMMMITTITITMNLTITVNKEKTIKKKTITTLYLSFSLYLHVIPHKGKETKGKEKDPPHTYLSQALVTLGNNMLSRGTSRRIVYFSSDKQLLKGRKSVCVCVCVRLPLPHPHALLFPSCGGFIGYILSIGFGCYEVCSSLGEFSAENIREEKKSNCGFESSSS